MSSNNQSYAYIHGFNSDKNSRSYNDIKKLLTQNIQTSINSNTDAANNNVYDFYYNYMQNAELALKEIESKLLSTLKTHQKLTLIGSSLGGFFTLYLSDKYHLPCTVFNPVTFPHEQLAPFKGKNYNFYTNEEWNFTDKMLMSYKKINLNTQRKYCPNIILGTNDTVIDPNVTLAYWKKKANILLTTNEHSIGNYQDYLYLIKSCKNNLSAYL